MGAHNILFWMSLAAGVAAVCLLGMLRATRAPPPEKTHTHESEDLPPEGS